MSTDDQILRAADELLAEIRARPELAHASHLHVRRAGRVLLDEHLCGPEVADVFSVTKTVVALVAGLASDRGRLPALDERMSAVLPALRGTPAEDHTWRHLLTMTRGARTDGPHDVDELTALPGGQVAAIAAAPSVAPVGVFGYDNGAFHLLSAGLQAVLGEPVAAYARRELFDPLGTGPTTWRADPDGVSFGFAHLAIAAPDLGRLGDALLGRPSLVSASFLEEMRTAHTPGGPPEGLGYGFGLWVAPDHVMAAGWAGQLLLVVPAAELVVVTTGWPDFRFGPPPSDRLPPGWRPALDAVRGHLLPVVT